MYVSYHPLLGQAQGMYLFLFKSIPTYTFILNWTVRWDKARTGFIEKCFRIKIRAHLPISLVDWIDQTKYLITLLAFSCRLFVFIRYYIIQIYTFTYTFIVWTYTYTFIRRWISCGVFLTCVNEHVIVLLTEMNSKNNTL